MNSPVPWQHINLNGPGGCWLWTGRRTTNGYGHMHFRESRDEKWRSTTAHRLVYLILVGPIPEGLQLDHYRCDNRLCVNPEHVRPVTARENALRSNAVSSHNLAKTHCKNGHEFTPENTRPRAEGGRSCRTCHNNNTNRRRQAARDAA